MKKCERFCLQMTTAERELLGQLAEDGGEWNLSFVVRQLIREEGRRRGLWPPKLKEG